MPQYQIDKYQKREPRNTHAVVDCIWSTPLNEASTCLPILTPNLLLIATQESDPSAHHATLHAIDPRDGDARWQQTFEYALISGLASAPPLILVSTTSTDLIRGQGALVALNAAGEKLCRWTPNAQRLSAPAVAGNVACVTVDAQTLLILDLSTGEGRDQVSLGVNASLSAPVLADDVAFVPCRGPHLLAVGLDSQVYWRFDAAKPTDVWLDETPVVVGERLFAVLTSGEAVALRMDDGSLLWQMDVGPAGKSTSAPATDGVRLFVGARDGLHALDLDDGREIWTFPTPRRIAAAPVAAGGVVYAACHDHHLYALDAATGQELWRHEVERRIERPPLLANCGEPARPGVLIADRGGTLTAVARPLGAAELEAAGQWAEAAAQWQALGWFLKQAEALEKHAQSLENKAYSLEERADAWANAARAFEAEGEVERADDCQREVARWLSQPLITLDVEHEGLVLETWSKLELIVHNKGYGPARNLVIRASGDEFEGQVMRTQRITTLRAERNRTERLDIRPLEHGSTVPLRVQVEYLDRSDGKHCHEHTIYIAVTHPDDARRQGETISIARDPGRTRYLTQLRQILRERFDEDELRDFCFDLNVDYDSLRGEGKADKARELLCYLERRNRIPELVEIGKTARPDVSWEEEV